MKTFWHRATSAVVANRRCQHRRYLAGFANWENEEFTAL